MVVIQTAGPTATEREFIADRTEVTVDGRPGVDQELPGLVRVYVLKENPETARVLFPASPSNPGSYLDVPVELLQASGM